MVYLKWYGERQAPPSPPPPKTQQQQQLTFHITAKIPILPKDTKCTLNPLLM